MRLSSLASKFEEVFYAASKLSLTATHRVAAWNALCGLIDQLVGSDCGQIRRMIWSQHIWDRSFDLYLNQSQHARPKSAKQLLATLGAALRESEEDLKSKMNISELILAGIKKEDGHGLTKSCLQALALFLGRNVLPLDIVLRALLESTSGPDIGEIQSATADLLAVLFNWVGRGDFGSTISQAVSTVLNQYDQHKPDGKNSELPVWLEPLENAIQSNNVPFDDLRTQIMPTVFNRSLPDYTVFLYRHGLQQLIEGSHCNTSPAEIRRNGNMELLLAALVTGKEQGLLYETEDSTVSQTSASIFLPLRYIQRLIHLRSRNARVVGLSLLVISRSATKPLPSLTFRILMRCFPILFTDTDANFRSEVVSLVQRLMDRLRAATAVLARQSKDNEDSRVILTEHAAFLKWLLRFLSWELRPSASYQRHISALKTLLVVTKAGVDGTVPSELLSKSALNETKWPFTISIMTSGLRRQLLDLLMDPFDDVRQISGAILSIYAASYDSSERSNACKELINVVDRAENTMLATGRADHADGVAQLYRMLFLLSDTNPVISGPGQYPQQPVILHLVEDLERMLDAAERSLAVAANKYPLHGLLTSVRYIMSYEDSSGFGKGLDHLVDCLYRVWEIVKPVLCNDAPEGYVPDDTDELQDVTSKDTLSYCWRALKESSLLLGTIVNQKLLDTEGLIELSNLCFTQLAELRHRGAFSTVAQMWIICCGRCKDVDIAGTNAIYSWYSKVLSSLENKTTINTRRSAGLPALICGLLIADKTGLLTTRAIHDLSAIARQAVDVESTQESSLPQVHALNCTKDILKNTRLSEHSDRFITHAFVIAAQSLHSPAWAIRNCGLMLFRASIDRLLGTSEAHLDDDSHSQHGVFLIKQPELLDAIFSLLRSPIAGSGGSEGIFPALQLLKNAQLPATRRSEAMSAVLHLTSSPSWHVRNKAARTYASIVDDNLADSEFQRLLIMEQSTLNAQHGALLCAKYMALRLFRHHQSTLEIEADGDITESNGSSTNSVDDLCAVIDAASHVYLRSACPLIRSAFMGVMLACSQCVRHCYVSDHKQPKAVGCQDSVDVAEELSLSMIERSFGPGQSELRRTMAQALAHQLYMGMRSDHDRIVLLITKLGEADADACSSMFKELRALAISTASDPGAAIGVLLAVSSNILRGHYDIGLKCEVQAFLLSIANHRAFKDRDSHFLAVFADACEVASTPLNRASNQLYADRWLQLQAVRLDHRVEVGSSPNQRLRQEIGTFVSSCKLAIEQDESTLFTPEAAALALNNIKYLWHYLILHLPPLLLDLCFGIYDLLNDDDEDIRHLAAGSTSRIVDCEKGNRHGAVREPISASQDLIKFMLKRWSTDFRFATEVFQRAFGMRDSGHISSVADRLVASSAMDTALFVEEKQNLYVDDAGATRLWSQVVFALQPSAIPRIMVRRLAEWVSEGLDSLTTRAASDGDGPLGWTTKPDVFLLGLQTVYGTEAILRLAEGGIVVPIRPSTLRLKLFRFGEVARAQRINQLWVREIERVVAWSVNSRLVLQRRLMNEIVDRHKQ